MYSPAARQEGTVKEYDAPAFINGVAPQLLLVPVRPAWWTLNQTALWSEQVSFFVSHATAYPVQKHDEYLRGAGSIGRTSSGRAFGHVGYDGSNVTIWP